MNAVVKTWNLSIVYKAIMAVTGVMLVGFVVGHLLGNLQIFLGPETFNGYAEKLRHLGPLLWMVRIVMLVAVALHIYVGIKLKLENLAARPVDYRYRRYVRANTASRTMIWSGAGLGLYLVYHLAHLTFKITNPTLYQGNLYLLVVHSFKIWWISFSYIVAMVILCFHIYHGATSMFQSLGLNHERYNPIINKLGPALGILLAVGYISIPLAVLLGWIPDLAPIAGGM